MFCSKCKSAMYEMEDTSYYCIECGHVENDLTKPDIVSEPQPAVLDLDLDLPF